MGLSAGAVMPTDESSFRPALRKLHTTTANLVCCRWIKRGPSQRPEPVTQQCLSAATPHSPDAAG